MGLQIELITMMLNLYKAQDLLEIEFYSYPAAEQRRAAGVVHVDLVVVPELITKEAFAHYIHEAVIVAVE